MLNEYYYMEGRSGKKCDMKVIQYLLDNHAIVDDRALQEAVRWHSTDLLATLLQNTTSIRQRGVDAVVEAATTNNFEAVNMLLDAGVDVNTDFVRNPALFRYLETGRRHETVSLLCQVIELWTSSFEDLNNMIDYLVQRGAHFRLSKTEPLLSELLETEKAQQLSIIKLLLDSRAKVNAAPAQSEGRTALQLAAKHGNLEVTMLLLSCNPPADVNMPPCQYPESFDPCGNALDLAAQHGRLDVVKLLLNNDALSSCPGNTGYDGAIQGAEKKGWLAVADLIRQHAMAVSRSNTTRTNLTQPQRDWHEYGYDDYSDEYTTFDEDEEEDAEDNESAESREKEDSVAQVQIQTEAVEYPGTEHAAPEPGWVSEMEVDDSPEFDIGFSNLDGDMGSLYGLDYAPSTSHLNTAASGWGLGQ
ncbi:ankyrin repeat-containing domain protein [Diaporthe sp. PMI_573]|nr:ankyrin repeat-containing domain protein [Diaporthaceae sp. PMI_573]